MYIHRYSCNQPSPDEFCVHGVCMSQFYVLLYLTYIPNYSWYTQHNEDATGPGLVFMHIGIHVMCKDYNHLLFRDEFLRVSSLEGLHCQLWCTY